VTLRASSRPLASRAVARSMPPLPVSSLSGGSDTRISLCQALSTVRIFARYSARKRERETERERERARAWIRDSEKDIRERARCNGTSVTQSWEDYGIETPGGKAQCQSALHFVPVSTESVTRDVVFAAFPRKVSGGRARDGRGDERKKNDWRIRGRGGPKRGKGRMNERTGWRRGGTLLSLSVLRATYSHSTGGIGTAGAPSAPSSTPRRNFARPRAPPDTHVSRSFDRCRNTRISPTLLFFFFSLYLFLSLSFSLSLLRFLPAILTHGYTQIKCNGSASVRTALLSRSPISTLLPTALPTSTTMTRSAP